MKRVFGILVFVTLMMPLRCQVPGNKIIHVSGPDALRELTTGNDIIADSLISSNYLMLTSLSNYDSRAIAAFDKILTYSHAV